MLPPYVILTPRTFDRRMRAYDAKFTCTEHGVRSTEYMTPRPALTIRPAEDQYASFEASVDARATGLSQ
jgi:hypothetical protein